MKIKKIRKINNLFGMCGGERSTDKEMDNFLFCGDLNWDYYFDKKVKNSEKIENAKLIEFYNKRDFEKYLVKIKRINLLDYFFEKDYFAILEVK